jgi:hypothetical protein
VEINQRGAASLGEIIEVYSSDEEGQDVPMADSSDIIQIDCTDQTFADLLRLNVGGVTVNPPMIPAGHVISTTLNNTLMAHGSLVVTGNPNTLQPRPSTSMQGSNQVSAMSSQNILQILAAYTNGLVTEPLKPTPTSTPNEEKRVAMVKPLVRLPKRRTCLNLNCKKTAPNMEKAGFVELYYFGYPMSKKRAWICDSCNKLIGDFRKVSTFGFNIIILNLLRSAFDIHC